MASYSDNFAGTLSNWTSVNGGTWAIVSGEVRQTASSGVYRWLRYNSAMASANYYVEARIRTSNAGVGCGLMLRGPGSGTASTDMDGYAVIGFIGDLWYLVRMVNGEDGFGSGANIDTYSPGPTSGTMYTVRLEANGSTIRVLIDSVERLSASDSTWTTGTAVGLLSYAGQSDTTTYYADDFAAADLAGGSTYNLTASATAASATPDTTVLAVARSLVAAATAASATPDTPALRVTRAFAAAATGASATPDTVTLNVASVIALTAQATAASVTPNTVALAVQRAMGASATAASATPESRGGLRFNGNGADVNRVRVALEDGASTQYPANLGATHFTVEFWITCTYAENTTTATDEDARYSNIVYDRDDFGAQRGHVIGVTRSGASLVVCFGQAGSGGSWATIFSTANVGDGKPHHAAVTRNISTGSVRIFVDGVQEASGTYDTTDWSFPAGRVNASGQDNQSLILGCEKHDLGFMYAGSLDELRLSNTVRYTASFTPQRHLQPDADTRAFYPLDEGTGTVAADRSGVTNAQPGTLLVGGSPSGPTWETYFSGALFNVTRALAASATAASSTPDTPALRLTRALAASATASSATPDTVTLNVATVRALTASATAVSATPIRSGWPLRACLRHRRQPHRRPRTWSGWACRAA